MCDPALDLSFDFGLNINRVRHFLKFSLYLVVTFGHAKRELLFINFQVRIRDVEGKDKALYNNSCLHYLIKISRKQTDCLLVILIRQRVHLDLDPKALTNVNELHVELLLVWMQGVPLVAAMIGVLVLHHVVCVVAQSVLDALHNLLAVQREVQVFVKHIILCAPCRWAWIGYATQPSSD